MTRPLHQDNKLFTAIDGRGIGMLDAGDRRGHKNAYIDLLHKIAIKEVYPFSGHETVLEYGCGAGRIAVWLGELARQVIAADPDPQLLAMAGSAAPHGRVCYVQIRPGEFPFSDASFDLVTCIGLLRLLSDEEAGSVLRGIKHALKPRGELICIDQASPRSRPGQRTLERLAGLFKDNGMATVDVRAIRKGHWPALYLIQLGLIPKGWFERIARHELRSRPGQRRSSWDYYQYIFHYVMT
jgi:ubiquinone/menaquinone biosynthesis C-methylase UbiE